jgi:TPR repeat protein
LHADKKPGEAQDHFVKAATQGANHSAGIYDAAIMAAVNYAFGQGVPRDMKKADEMLALSKTLARRNVLLVTHNMVEQKLVDDFAQADVEEGATAETDKIETRLQFAIAGSLADPKSKTYDPKEAAKWYELAAEKGEAWAMLSLAFIHHEGHLGQPDPVKAFEWFKKAAEKGNHNLGWADLSICYERGLGTPADHAKAAEIWQKRRDNSIVCYLGSIGQCQRRC